MKVSIAKLSGELIEVDVQPAASVRDLQLRAQELLLSSGQVKLILGNSKQALDPSLTLEATGVYDGALLTLVATPCGPQPLHVLTSSLSTAKLWSIKTGACLRTFEGRPDLVSADGLSILTTLSDENLRHGRAKLWSVETGKCIQQFSRHKYDIDTAAFSEDGASLLTQSSDSAKLWNVGSGVCRASFSKGYIYAAAFCGEYAAVLTVFDKVSAKLYNIESTSCIHDLPTADSNITQAVFFDGGVSLLIVYLDNTVRLWNTEIGICVQAFSDAGHDDGYLWNVGFSADCMYVLTSSDEETKLWDISTGACIQKFRGTHNQPLTIFGCSVCSVDCSSVLNIDNANNVVNLWSKEGAKCIQVFKGHKQKITTAAISPDGSLVLTSSQDKTAKLWSTTSGDCLRSFACHNEGVSAAIFASVTLSDTAEAGNRVVGGNDVAAICPDAAAGNKCTKASSSNCCCIL